MEYYFGDYNFPKDKWMLNKVTELEDGTYIKSFRSSSNTMSNDDAKLLIASRLVRHGNNDDFQETEELN